MVVSEFYIALTVGLVVSLLIQELLGVTCGGIIVPGYLAMMCDDWVSMLVLLVISLLVYLIVQFVLPHFIILFGQRRFVACLLVGLILKLACNLMVPVVPYAELAFEGFGVVIPGLIANTCMKQGVHITIPAVIVSTAIVYGITRLLLLLV